MAMNLAVPSNGPRITTFRSLPNQMIKDQKTMNIIISWDNKSEDHAARTIARALSVIRTGRFDWIDELCYTTVYKALDDGQLLFVALPVPEVRTRTRKYQNDIKALRKKFFVAANKLIKSGLPMLSKIRYNPGALVNQLQASNLHLEWDSKNQC